MTVSKRIILNAIIIFISIATASAVIAAKGGKGKPGGNEPPVECPVSEQVPGMILVDEGHKRKPDTPMIANSDGCQIDNIPAFGSFGTVHFAKDDNGDNDGCGIMVWRDTSDPFLQDKVFGATFETLADGSFSLGDTTQLLPLVDEIPGPEEPHHYFTLDLWGNADHTVIYLAAFRLLDSNGPNETRQVIIYTLDKSNGISITHKEVVHTTVDVANPGNVSWTCPPGTTYPQFVATCYPFEGAYWNASGTRLFSKSVDLNNEWQMNFKLDVISARDPRDLNSSWSFGAAEVVLVGARGSQHLYGEPRLKAPRPESDVHTMPTTDEYAFTAYLDRTGNNTVRAMGFLNIDKCIDEYSTYANAQTAPPTDLWKTNCFEEGVIFHEHVRDFDVWQTRDSVLAIVLEGNKRKHLYRYYVDGPKRGIAELLRETTRAVDRGL